MRLAPGMAIAWELWHRGKWWFMMAVITNVFILLGTTSLGPDPQIKLHALIKIFPLIVLSEMMMYAAMIAQAQGGYIMSIPPRYYRHPISTGALVGWHIGITAAMVSLMHLAMCAIAYLMTGTAVPVLAPVLFIILALVSFQAMLFLLSGRMGLIVCAGFLNAFGLLIWLFHVFDSGGKDAWPMLTLFHALWLAIAIAFCCAAALIGARRERRGDAGASIGLREWWDGVMLRFRTRRAGFDSPQAAQFWFERRSNGGPTLAIMMLPIIAVAALSFIEPPNARTLETAFAMSMLCLFGGAVPIGLLIGRHVKAQAGFTIDLFKVTRPLTDRQIAWTTLRSAAVEIAAGWIVFAILAAAVSAWIDIVDIREFSKFWSQFHIGDGWHAAASMLAAIASGMVIHWILIGLGLTLALTGRPHTVVIFFMTAFVCFFGMIYLNHHRSRLNDWVFWTVWIALLVAVPLILLLAAHRKYIPWIAAIVPIGLVILIAVLGGPSKVPDELTMLTLGAFMLLTPLASAPLALAWNRHR